MDIGRWSNKTNIRCNTVCEIGDNMLLLNFPKEVTALEQECDDKKVIDYLSNLWANDQDDINILLCLASKLWITLVYWRLDEDRPGLDRQELSDFYTAIVNYGFENFNSDERFLIIVGYMLDVIPYWYGDYKDFDTCAKKGLEMIKEAYKKNPQNLIGQLFSSNSDEQRAKIIEKITPVFNNYFVGDTSVITYFRSICCKIDY